MDDPRIEEAKQFLRFCGEADANNRAEALDDVRFCAGDQWPVETQNSRLLESRPCLTINKVDAYVRQICNQQRQQRPRIKVHGMNSESDAKVAEILTGICRHIEVQSNADHAYDTAFEYAVKMGWGYFRITTDYVREDSFDQEIYIKPIENPFTVYFDPNSQAPDGRDAEKALITTVMTKKAFSAMYPDAEVDQGFNARGTGDSNAEWVMREDIRIAEYFYTVRKPVKLVLLSDGTTVKKSELPDEQLMNDAGVFIINERESHEKEIKWVKLTGMQILEESTWPGKYIPIVPVYGQTVVVDSKHKKFGLVRQAKDPQKMYNYWTTALTESVALAPKAKWILAEGQDEGHENEWAQANIASKATLRYKQTDIDGRVAPPPIRQQPEAPPTGITTALQGLNADLMAVVGIYDPSQLPQGMQSGKAIQGQQMQVDMVNYHYFDNLTRSISHVGTIILDLVPKIYDTQRVMRIIGDDGKPDLVNINQPGVDEQGVQKILNDVTVGQYDVVMDTGPGYNSKRSEAVESMMTLLAADPNLMQTAGDLIFRNMDFPGADVVADRLAAANPMAQIDDKSPIPPQVQMQLKANDAQMQQMQQEIQRLNIMIQERQDMEQVKQDNMTKRELMKVTAKAHEIEMNNATRRADTQTRAQTAIHDTDTRTDTMVEIENLKGQFAMILSQIDAAARRAAAFETTERAI